VCLEQWKAAVRTSGIAELIAFVDGLADDAEAVANGCSMTWSNGMVEGFVNKVKWIKRSSYGQAGFPLLQRRSCCIRLLVNLLTESRGNAPLRGLHQLHTSVQVALDPHLWPLQPSSA